MSWNVKCHEMLNIMKCKMSWNVKCHEMSNVIKCQMSWNVKCREMSNITKCWCWCWIYDSKQTRPALHTSERTIVPRTVIFKVCSLVLEKLAAFSPKAARHSNWPIESKLEKVELPVLSQIQQFVLAWPPVLIQNVAKCLNKSRFVLKIKLKKCWNKLDWLNVSPHN